MLYGGLVPCHLFQQTFNLRHRETFHQRLLAFERCSDYGALLLLKAQDFLLHRVAGNEFVARDNFLLADPVRPIRGLGFHRRIPPGVEMDDRVGGGQVQAGAARFQTDEENWNIARLETRHLPGAIMRLAVQVAVCDRLRVEPRSDVAEHRHELAENEHPVATINRFFEQFVQEVQLGGRFGLGWRVFHAEQAGVTCGLPQAQKCREHQHSALVAVFFAGQFREALACDGGELIVYLPL